MKENNARLHYIDIARAISILLLVIGHALGYSINSQYIYKIIYCFVVPLFFLVSGFLMSIKGSYVEHIRNKFVRIMIPYFIWAVLFLIPFWLFGSNVADRLGVSLQDGGLAIIRKILYGVGKDHNLQQNSSLWFLPALYTMNLFFYPLIHLIEKIKNEKACIGTLVVLVIGGGIANKYLTITLPWGINTVLVAGVYYFIGYLLNRYKVIEWVMHSKYHLVSLISFGIVGLSVGSLNKALDFMNYSIGNIWFAYISGIFVSILILCLSYKIRECSPLEYIGKNTMPIMIFHKLPILLFQTKLGEATLWLTNSNMLVEVMMSLIAAASAVLFALAIAKVLKKIAPFSIGESRKK